jgi:hypothetical protein
MSERILRNAVLAAALAAAGVAMAACGPSYTGTYTDPTGAMQVTLKSGGAATLTFENMTADCTYTVNGTAVTLVCKGDAGTIHFTLRPDGTLAGPPDSLFPPLKKK